MRTSDYRAAARAVLRGKWLKMVAIMLLATLLGVTVGVPEPITFNFEMEYDLDEMAMMPAQLGIPDLSAAEMNQIFRTVLVTVAIIGIYLLLVGSYVTVGLAGLGSRVLDGEQPRIGMLFPRGIFWKAVGMNLMRTLLVSFWALFLVIPGIFAAYNYSMADYILYTHPEMGVMEVLRESKQRMYGHRMGLFVLELSFIGWALLASLPAMTTAFAGFSPMFWAILGIGSLVSMIAGLFVQTYMHVSFIAYFRNVDRASVWKHQAQAGEAEFEQAFHGGEESAEGETVRPEEAPSVDMGVARSLFMEHGCSRTRMREEGILEEYAQMNIDSAMEAVWIRDYAQALMLRFNRDALALDKLLLLAGEYGMDDLTSRILERIERHVRQQTLPDAEILNMAGRVLALLVSGAFADKEGFVQRKKQQIVDLAERLEQRLEQAGADGWQDAMRLIRSMCE